ncbi:MAG: ribosome maturation factor RimM [Firmicutes bacterium]|nr:ribosome maturation factor RimM [Bacillota bacterium]
MSPRKQPEVWPGHILVGEVTAPFGIDGSLRVLPTTDFPERFVRLREVTVDRLGGVRAVEQARLALPMAVIKLKGVDTRTAAEALRGALLMVPEAALPPLPEGEYYWHQLVGLTVEEVGTGRVLGRIAHVLRTGAPHDVFEVDRPGRKPLLIPALKSVVREVDLGRGVMSVVLLPGLEDVSE